MKKSDVSIKIIANYFRKGMLKIISAKIEASPNKNNNFRLNATEFLIFSGIDLHFNPNIKIEA
jgi:hypothetical protein